MAEKKEKKIYRAAIYLRLSDQILKEEAEESDSIANQESLIRQYLEDHNDIRVKYRFKDDGWSGVDFDRPGFQKMMQKIYDNEIDCVIVKDLSRLGRNHTETGRYLSRVFPFLGVRFIAVADGLDSLHDDPSDRYIIPFKDLVNDSYSRDISMKIRAAKKVKNAAGSFSGSFYPYGYAIDPDDKNHYVIDEEAARVIRMIYSWSFDGITNTEIVRRLNRLHILPPSEYKKKRTAKHYIPSDAKWNTRQIFRILRNDVYTGTLRLGKSTTPNYKVKKVIQVPEEKQNIFENAHEPIISREEFDLMQEMLAKERSAGVKKDAYRNPLAGYLFCADCGEAMSVQNIRTRKASYHYFVCGKNKKDPRECSRHTIDKKQLEQVVLKALNIHLRVLLDAEEFISERTTEELTRASMEKLQIRIGKILEKKQEYEEYIKGMYRDYKEGILTLEEYRELQKDMREQMADLERDAAELEMEKNTKIKRELESLHWIQKYKEKGRLTQLSRRDVVALIDRVEIRDEKHIKIRFRFGDAYKDHLKKANRKEIKAMKQDTAS